MAIRSHLHLNIIRVDTCNITDILLMSTVLELGIKLHHTNNDEQIRVDFQLVCEQSSCTPALLVPAIPKDVVKQPWKCDYRFGE